LQSQKAMGEYKIYLGSNSLKYLEAVMTGDKKAEEELRVKFAKEQKERTEQEYAWLKTNLPPKTFEAFNEIEKTYERNIGSTNNALFWGSWYRYYWNAKDIQIDYNDYGKFHLTISFRKEEFYLYVYYCDESGYDQGGYCIESNVDPENIVERIANLKTQVLNGYKIEVQ
jgi:hypothetical protein